MLPSRPSPPYTPPLYRGADEGQVTAVMGQVGGRIGDRERALIAQLVRFGVAGGITTSLYAVVYWPIATYMPHLLHVSRGAWPMAGNVLGYLVAMLSGYWLHSSWSFRGHGERGDLTRTGGRFLAVSLVSFVVNSLWVWGLTGPWMHGPTWWPLLPILFVTPLMSFALNRLWVFG